MVGVLEVALFAIAVLGVDGASAEGRLTRVFLFLQIKRRGL